MEQFFVILSMHLTIIQSLRTLENMCSFTYLKASDLEKIMSRLSKTIWRLLRYSSAVTEKNSLQQCLRNWGGGGGGRLVITTATKCHRRKCVSYMYILEFSQSRKKEMNYKKRRVLHAQSSIYVLHNHAKCALEQIGNDQHKHIICFSYLREIITITIYFVKLLNNNFMSSCRCSKQFIVIKCKISRQFVFVCFAFV